MLDMGFEPEMRKLIMEMGMPGKQERQTLMFSATFANDIQKLAADFMNDYVYITVGRVGGANTDVEQNIFEVTQFEKKDKLQNILVNSGDYHVKELMSFHLHLDCTHSHNFKHQSSVKNCLIDN